MPITTDQIKLFKSQVMADTPDGGGGMSGDEVIDGELNNVFDDTSELDRIRGRVSLRFIYGAVVTEDRQKLLGTHTYLTDPPDDSKVVCTLLGVSGSGLRREDAREYVEQYLVAGAPTVMTLYELHPAGTRTLVVYQPMESSVPEVSDVIVLSVEKAGHVNNGYQQFVRITGVAEETITVDPGSSGAVQKRLITLEISEALEIDFPGGDIVKDPKANDRPTRIRQTNSNSGVRYYGVVPLAEEVDIGDTELQVDSILQSIVPASYAETPILDQQLGAETLAIVPAGPAYTETIVASSDAGGNATLLLPRAAKPGSIAVVAEAAGSDNDASFEDAGAGVLERTAGGVNTASAAGTANYATRELAFTGLGASISYSVAVTYIPAAAVPDVQHTAGTLITLANRGFNYSRSLIPKPTPGALVFSFQALGKWYTLQDNGAGQLVGAAGTGAGTVNYLTGTANATCGYQPDVGSHVLWGWGSGAHYLDQTANADIQLGAIRLTFDEPCKPGSMSASWEHASTTYTVTDDGEGNLAGDCVVGSIDYSSRELQFLPTVYPAKGSSIDLDYLKLSAGTHTPSPQPTPSGGTVSFIVPGAPHEPGTIEIQLQRQNEDTGRVIALTLRDDGAGVLLEAGTSVGSYNYTTGEAVIAETRTY